MRLAILGVSGFLMAVPVLAQQGAPPAATPAAALVRAGVTEKLTAHVWAIPDGSAPRVPNVGIIVGSRAVLVVDTGLGRRNGQTVLAEVGTVGAGKPIYIVTTHFHPEHDLGAGAFPADAKMIRSEDQKKDIAELLKDETFRAADVSFEKEYLLDLGGMTARIIAMGANHTRGDTVVLAEGVRFSGDVAMRPQPSFASPYSTVSHWLESLNRLDALKPVHVVPSHRQRGDAAIIAGYRAYLTRIQARAAALKREHKSESEVVQIITDEMVKQYPDQARLGGAIRAVYAEVK